MPVSKREVVSGDELYVSFPLTVVRSSARLKRRKDIFHEGEDFAPTSTPLDDKVYLEWQIGYSIPVEWKGKNGIVHKGEDRTSLTKFRYQGRDGGERFAWELGELLFYLHERGKVSDEQIGEAYDQICSVGTADVLDMDNSMFPYRQGGAKVEKNGISFLSLNFVRPILTWSIEGYDVIAEITKSGRQIGSGLQMMLYLCIPLSSLHFEDSPLGRPVRSKEHACWVVGARESSLILGLFRIFGMLSSDHKEDVLSIFKMMFPNIVTRG